MAAGAPAPAPPAPAPLPPGTQTITRGAPSSAMGAKGCLITLGLMIMVLGATIAYSRISDAIAASRRGRAERARAAQEIKDKEDRLAGLLASRGENLAAARAALAAGDATKAATKAKLVLEVDEGHAEALAVQAEAAAALKRQEEAAAAEKDKAARPYFVNPTGAAYHVEGCKWIEAGARRAALEEAAEGRRPCRTCKPPKYSPPAPTKEQVALARALARGNGGCRASGASPADQAIAQQFCDSMAASLLRVEVYESLMTMHIAEQLYREMVYDQVAGKNAARQAVDAFRRVSGRRAVTIYFHWGGHKVITADTTWQGDTKVEFN